MGKLVRVESLNHKKRIVNEVIVFHLFEVYQHLVWFTICPAFSLFLSLLKRRLILLLIQSGVHMLNSYL